ncbi:MAG: hypothetical protein UMR38_06295 [Candidatus Izemoplasma sp.]|nr:hypothetical protein [Candidatus Izemoplasma sp.]
MKRLLIVSLLSTLSILTGCNNPDNYLDYHQDYMNNLDAYTILYTETKGSLENTEVTNKYVYVDNDHEMWRISDVYSEDLNYTNGDIIFTKNNGSYFQYVYDEQWLKYERDASVEVTKFFEQPFYDYVKHGTMTNNNTELVFEHDVLLGDLDPSKYYDIFGIEIPTTYHNYPVRLVATYNTEDDVFTSFKIDFTEIYEAWLSDINQSMPSVTWEIDIAYDMDMNAFALSLPQAINDDHANNMNPFNFIKVVTTDSFEFIEGILNYGSDIDLLGVHIDRTDRYQLSLRELTVPTNLIVKIYDENMNVIEEILFEDNDTSTYYNLPKGDYYVGITSNDEKEDVYYKILFQSH